VIRGTLFRWICLRIKQQWLRVDGPLFASCIPGKFAIHIRIEALQQREAGGIGIVEPDGGVDPVGVVAYVDGLKLDVKAAADDIRETAAGLKLLALAGAFPNGVDHAMAEFAVLIEDNDFRVLIVVEETGGVRPGIAFVGCPRNDAQDEPAKLIDDAEEFPLKIIAVIEVLRVSGHEKQLEYPATGESQMFFMRSACMPFNSFAQFRPSGTLCGAMAIGPP
jgi:hypothetical protein